MGNVTSNGRQDALAVITVDLSGNYVAAVGGSGLGNITTVNSSAGPAITIAGLGSVTVTTVGTTVNVSGSSSGAGDVVGPASALNDGITLFNGGTGKIIYGDSNLNWNRATNTIVGTSGLGIKANTGSATLQALDGLVSIVGTSGVNSLGISISQGNSAKAILISSAGAVNIESTTDVITLDGNTFPALTSKYSLGNSSLPWSGITSLDYKTVIPTLTHNGATQTINWASGASQSFTFLNGQPSGVTISLTNGTAGSSYALETVNSASGTGFITWTAGETLWAAGISGSTTLTSGTKDLFSFYYDGAKYVGSALNNLS